MKIHLQILTLLLLVLTVLPTKAQDEISSSLYLGFILVDEPTVDGMSEICDYYGLQAIPTTDGYTTYQHADGTIFRFKQSDDHSEGMDGRLLEIQTSTPNKEINQALKNLMFKKSGSAKVTINTDSTDRSTVKTVTATTYDQGSQYARTFLRAYVTSSDPHTITFRYIDTQ